MAVSSGMRFRSTRCRASRRPSRNCGMRSVPPASTRASPLHNASTAAAALFGLWYSKSCKPQCSPAKLLHGSSWPIRKAYRAILVVHMDISYGGAQFPHRQNNAAHHVRRRPRAKVRMGPLPLRCVKDYEARRCCSGGNTARGFGSRDLEHVEREREQTRWRNGGRSLPFRDFG